MIDRKIIKFLLRRGTDVERQQVVFETGEMVYTTDTKRLFIGDGVQVGGNSVSTPIKIANGLPLSPDLSDAVYDTITNDTFIYTVSGFKPLTNLAPISAAIDSRVNSLSAAIDTTNSHVGVLSANVASLSAALADNSVLSGAVLSTVSTAVTASSKFITFTNSGVNYGIRLWEI